MIKFTVPGNPVAKGRPRFFNRGTHIGTYTPEKTETFENKVAVFARNANVRIQEGNLKLIVNFYVRRPLKLMGKKWPDQAILSGSRPDLDNLIKSIKDGLNGIAYKDDSQICQIEAAKYYHEKAGVPRTEIGLI